MLISIALELFIEPSEGSGKVESIPLTTIHRITIMKIVYLWHPKSDFCSDGKNGVCTDKSGLIPLTPSSFYFLMEHVATPM